MTAKDIHKAMTDLRNRRITPDEFRTIMRASREQYGQAGHDRGTVGPLPDRTVIEVEQVLWADLADRADCFPVPWSHEKIIDAFNAREPVA